MNRVSPTLKREGASPSGVSKLAWPLITLGGVLLGLALFFSLYARSYRLPPDEVHRNCFIEFTTPEAQSESVAPPQSAHVEPLRRPRIQETDGAQVEFAFASFNIQDSPRPTPTQTPEAGQKRGQRKGVRRIFDWLRGKSSKAPKAPVEKLAKRRPTPPRLDASTYNVSLCPGTESAARVQVTASGFNPSCPPLAYHWRVDGGRVEGRGAKIVWNLWGMPPGKYRATFKADIDPNCYDCRDCDVFGSTKVTVRPCPTATPTPAPKITPTPTPTPKPTPSYTCPNVYCSTVTHGNSMTFTAQASGGTPNVSPIYRWSVSAGRISGGQGTSSIQVDTTGLVEGTKISATVEVRGYGRVCLASCQSLVSFHTTPTPTPSPTPTPTPTPSPTPTPENRKERQIVSLHYPKQLTKGQGATISFTWTRVSAETDEKGSAGISPVPRTIPASFLRTADEQPPTDVATLHLHSNDLNPRSWSLQLPLGEERSLTINSANYAEQPTFTLEVDALEVDGVLWKKADAGYRFWREESGNAECGARSFVITVFAPPSPYVPMAFLLGGVIALLAGDYLRRMAQGATLKEMEESLLAESKQAAAAATEGDEVRCTVFAPTEARQGKSFMVIAFAHLAEQAALLAEMAKGMSKSVEQRGPGKKLGAKIERGQELTFSLEMPGMEIDEPNQSIIWEGEPDSVQFGVTIPKDFEIGSIIATVRVAYKSVPVGHVKFEFEVVEGAPQVEKPAVATAAPAPPPVAAPVSFDNYVQYKQVFISYASQDRAEVLKRVQVMSMMKVNFFQDLLTLEPGDDWEKTIYQYLDRSDAVFLFWSSHAKTSEWVEKELKYVLSRQEAAPEIVPIIIEAPPPLPPPDYLKSLHFNDKIMYLIKVEEEGRRQEAQPDK